MAVLVGQSEYTSTLPSVVDQAYVQAVRFLDHCATYPSPSTHHTPLPRLTALGRGGTTPAAAYWTQVVRAQHPLLLLCRARLRGQRGGRDR